MINRTIAPPIKDAIDFDFHLPDIQQETFSNGIPVYTLIAGTQPVVQIEWVFKAGLWEEDKTGTAQAVGALLKNGTADRTDSEINEAIEFYGASLKVSVSNDYTSVILHTLTKHLPRLLPVIREVIISASFPQHELDIYRQNAIQALKVKMLNCDFVANRHIDALLFGTHHPYGRYTEAKDLEELAREDLLRFHQAYYRSDNCSIFIGGLVDQHDINLVNEYFGKTAWNSGQPAEQQFRIRPSEEKTLDLINNAEGVQAAIRIARHFIDRKHPDFVPMQVLNTVLGGYFGSRLMTNIREEKGYTYGIYSYIGAYDHASMLIITSEVGRDVSQAAMTEAAKEMQRLIDESIPAQELLLVKNYLLGSLLGDLDGPFPIIRYWKSLILNGFGKEEFNRRVEIYKKVSPEALQALAGKYLKPEEYYKLSVI